MTSAPTRTRGQPRPGGSFSSWLDRNIRWVFPLPALAALFALTILPLLFNLILSTQDRSVSDALPSRSVGLGNFVQAFQDPRFWNATKLMFEFTLIAVPLQMLLGLGLALLLNRHMRAQGLVRAAVLLPMISTPVAVGLIWALMMDPNLGVLNYFLQTLGLGRSLWLADPRLVIPALALVDIWQWTPLVALILLAGLQTMPDDPFEAARIDGASSWQAFRYITWPLLQPALFAALTIRLIDALKTFDIIEVMTQGGPGNASETLNVYAYHTGFEFLRVGYTASLLTLLLVIVAVVAIGVNLLRRQA
ncbi:sugar ABC transporter permease (plasmid) [Deinococcus metallilatus]|uniref:Multiple sugar transport system permease protein n=1 Tax=Deinococcus metallilatus TaxID=1211322 RepID=A0ABR6MYB7_9DEIO|nr:sugar ABC transporter permease [Deinococcus metallilatus]MBB5296947.1 multiple sugar transport system permease protein [Deinococcus metallilatus]QBY06685.1 sugar ABC transporter permease [Deinococcus metallilatus]GMA15154.1 ABC transporter permease [Deinococcus metallilatus]